MRALVPAHPIDWPIAAPHTVARVAGMIRAARRPLIMIGAAGNRPRLVDPLSEFVRRAGIPFFNTQMGKGAVTGSSDLYMGTAALSERDYVHDAIDQADLIVAIGHDTVEKPPFLMNEPGGARHLVHVGFLPANVEQVFYPDAELIGDIGANVLALASHLEGHTAADPTFEELRPKILAHINERAESTQFPIIPQRLVHDVRAVVPEDGHRLPGQRDVQNLVCAQLPHSRREHAVARQRARHHGGGTALRHHGEAAQSATCLCSPCAATAGS